MASLLSNLSLISFVIAFIFIVVSIILWFKLHIKSVISDLTGKTARESIAKMRKNNEEKAKRTGNEDNIAITYVPSNHEGNSNRNVSFDDGDKETDLLDDTGESSSFEEETDILVDGNLISHDENETDLLVDDDEETDFLEEDFETETLCLDKQNEDRDIHLHMIEDIEIVHTDKVIE